MRKLTLIAVTLLAACNAPSMNFQGIDPTRVTVMESTFDLRRREDQVLVIRVSREYVPRLSQQLGRRRKPLSRKPLGAQWIAYAGMRR